MRLKPGKEGLVVFTVSLHISSAQIPMLVRGRSVYATECFQSLTDMDYEEK